MTDDTIERITADHTDIHIQSPALWQAEYIRSKTQRINEYKEKRSHIRVARIQQKTQTKINRLKAKSEAKIQTITLKTNSRNAARLAKSTRKIQQLNQTHYLHHEQIHSNKSTTKYSHDEPATKTYTTIKPQRRIQKTRLDVHGQPKPAMRGWLHLIAAPLALAAGIVLICLAPSVELSIACAVFMTSSLILFGNSAAYHLGNWSPRVTDILRRIDHVNIFLLIAGTYTPPAFALSAYWRNTLLIGIWSCTAIAIVIHVLWINAPRWLVALVYVIFGIASVGFIGLFWVSPLAGPAVVILIASGGLCYIIGAICYACRRPKLWPRIFGFHEMFHTLTIAGYTCHVIAIYMIIVTMMITM